MINNITSSIQIHDNSSFQTHKSKLTNIEKNVKEVSTDIEKREQLNQSVEQKIQSDEKKFEQKSDSDVRKALMRQLNSPFPLISTEVLLKTI